MGSVSVFIVYTRNGWDWWEGCRLYIDRKKMKYHVCNCDGILRESEGLSGVIKRWKSLKVGDVRPLYEFKGYGGDGKEGVYLNLKAKVDDFGRGGFWRSIKLFDFGLFKVKIEHFMKIKARFLSKIKIKLIFWSRRCFLTGPNFLWSRWSFQDFGDTFFSTSPIKIFISNYE